ncbi:hypothetical protein SLS62_007136 [Diatrype stigma]|uniref:Uncharacterized protein n=1 Tax=Diatrype stigma TaxID=117547 RepID=A0AAN9YMD9_9PEZI
MLRTVTRSRGERGFAIVHRELREVLATTRELSQRPNLSQCNVTDNTDDEKCRYSWDLKIIDSTDITTHNAWLYSFFNSLTRTVRTPLTARIRIEFKDSIGVVIYTFFTVAIVYLANGFVSSESTMIGGIGTAVSVTPTVIIAISITTIVTDGIPPSGTRTRGSDPSDTDSGSLGSSTTYYTPIGVPATVPVAIVTTVAPRLDRGHHYILPGHELH